jgi:arginase
MKVEILAVPYDSGQEGVRLGRGPGHLLAAGLADRLREQGHDVAVGWVRIAEGFAAEIGTTFGLCRSLAGQVRRVEQANKLPVVLSGNCFVALGTMGGLGPADLGTVWFDAHGEYNTPETTASGCLDGMGLATATGDCWRALAASIPGFLPLPPERILLVGGHDFDPEERSRLARSRLPLANAEDLASHGVLPALRPALDRLAAQVGRLYVHIDLDVLDPAEAAANELSSAGGLSTQVVEEAVTLVRDRFEVAGVGVAGCDPAFDTDGRASRAACRILSCLLDDSRRSRIEAGLTGGRD